MESKTPEVPVSVVSGPESGRSQEQSSHRDEDSLQFSSDLEASACCCILSHASECLGLLSSAAGQTGTPTTGPDGGLALGQRAQLELKRPTVMEEREACARRRTERILKIHRDRFYLYRILTATLKDVDRERCFQPLLDATRESRERSQEERLLLQQSQDSATELRQLEAQLEQEKAASRFRLGRAHVEICNLEHKAHDAQIVSDIKRRLVDRWESSRREQLQLCKCMEEEACSKTTRLAKVDAILETRVHEEKKIFFERIIERYEIAAVEWSHRHAAEAERRDVELSRARLRLRELRNAMQRVRDTLERRQQEMSEYVEQRDTRRREEEALAEMNRAALRIQAWWRGTMFRRALKKARTKAKDRKSPEGKKSKI